MQHFMKIHNFLTSFHRDRERMVKSKLNRLSHMCFVYRTMLKSNKSYLKICVTNSKIVVDIYGMNHFYLEIKHQQ